MHNFPAGSGLLNDYFNTFAAACSPEGDIFMGGHEGLTVVSMQSVAQGGARPKLTLSEVTVGGRQVLADDDGVVRLSYDDRQIVQIFHGQSGKQWACNLRLPHKAVGQRLDLH